MNTNTSKNPQNSIVHLKKLVQGKQGVTGLIENKGEKMVYKISRYMNFLTDHEFIVMKGLEDLLPYCPHFCKAYSNESIAIDPFFNEDEKNPFEIDYNSFFLNVLTMEYVPDSISLRSLMEDKTIDPVIIIDIIKQILVAIIISQREKKFTHYDLHTDNILLKRCDKNNVHAYRLDKGNVILIPTHGYVPIIIDYGFSRSDSLNGGPSYLPPSYTEVGFMSPEFDWVADIKLFLITASDDFKDYRNCDNPVISSFRNIVKNMFCELNIDWRSGWDITNETSIADQVFSYVENIKESSELFGKYPHFSIDIIQSLITLPLKEHQGCDDLELFKKSYRIFVHEFSKIEDHISDVVYAIYFLKKLITLIRIHKKDFLNDITKDKAIQEIRTGFEASVDQTLKFFVFPSDLNWDLMITCILIFAEFYETKLFYLMNHKMKSKFKSYHKLPFKTPDEIIPIFDINFPCDHLFNTESKIVYYDTIEKTNYTLSMDEEFVNSINSANYLHKGCVIENAVDSQSQ